MLSIPSARLMAPKPATGELVRKNLVDSIINSTSKIVYVQGGAGHGKTTLLSQVAHSVNNAVWLSLDGENDVITFVNAVCEAINQHFTDFDFSVSEYLPFAEKPNFISMLAGVFICSIENIDKDFILIMDDVHSIEDEEVKKFIFGLIKYPPKNAKIYLGSREALWQEFISMKLKGSLMELTQKELAFTRSEIAEILGYDDSAVFFITEGWPLAVRSFKVLLDNGVSLSDIPSYGKETLYDYIFRECLANLDSGMVDFLKKSACFDELDPTMLDEVFDAKNSRAILESLVLRNIFTVKTGGGFYRYHALFRSGLLEVSESEHRLQLLHKAANYYLKNKQYSRAAHYATESKNLRFLEEIVLACYRDYIKAGKFNELGIWFKALNNAKIQHNPRILVAKGSYLSVLGNFVEAKDCLETAISLIDEGDTELYFEAMIHKARVLRNLVSFEESDKLLDELIARLGDDISEQTYFVVIEKLYNFCWECKIGEADALARRMIEICANAGNIKIMRWFERFLCAIRFFAGNMKETVYYYEKSIEIPEDERKFLGMHSVGIYAAKAYQMLGDRERSISILTDELQRLRNTGNYEEMWSGYLMAAEIYYQNTFIDRMNGLDVSFKTTIKYFTLANEYAPIYRKTDYQMQWVKLQRLTYSLMFTDEDKENILQEIFDNLNRAGAYLKCIVLARLMGYYGSIADFNNAVKCARLCIETGESIGMLLHSSLAYGIIVIVAIETKDYENAVALTRRYLKLCSAYGLYEYFRMHRTYDSVLEFAYNNGIEPEFTKEMMTFAGYQPKKAYVEALGAFTVYQDKERQNLIKFRTKKARELFAFLLDAGDKGATKEQIYNAIWWESESNNVKNLIAVNIMQLRNDLKSAGIVEAIFFRENRYFICKNKFNCDCDVFEKTYEKFKQSNNKDLAKKLIGMYKGEYLADFEALWASAKRIRYREIYEEAENYLSLNK